MLAGFRAQNHPQQVGKSGAVDRVDDRGTDPSFIAQVEGEFGAFTLDVAASALNAKAASFYTRENDGLALPWYGNVWCNPPYSDCGSWVRKAWAEWNAGSSAQIIMLLPANRCEQRWWQECVEPYRDRPGSSLRTRFLPGRMRFDRPGAAKDPRGDRPPFGCVLLIWKKEVTQ